MSSMGSDRVFGLPTHGRTEPHERKGRTYRQERPPARRGLGMFAMASMGEKQRRRVMRVGFEPHQLVRAPVIDDALHRLARQAPVAGDMRDRQRRGRGREGARDPPAGAGQAEVMNERVAGFDQVAVEAEDFDDETGQGARSGLAGSGPREDVTTVPLPQQSADLAVYCHPD